MHKLSLITVFYGLLVTFSLNPALGQGKLGLLKEKDGRPSGIGSSADIEDYRASSLLEKWEGPIWGSIIPRPLLMPTALSNVPERVTGRP